ncbi:MAG: helix-turn-helix domain-containing protein [Treponema sp.]|jgi:cytoskeletal protein RodZ|nr:helix-turn-helix domain-containing protein [Treponema sp.]
MESLGEKLKEARVEKGLSFDQISRETNILIRYLEALETENFTVFPGEPYVIGFLKNYGAYLDLDVQKLISLYRAFRIQEQPIPVEQLLKHPPKFPKFIIPAAAVLLIACGIGWGVYYLLFVRERKPVDNKPSSRQPSEYVMEGNSMERRFYRSDSVLIPIDTSMYKLELANLGEVVTIRTPGGSVILDLSQEANIDLNNDGIPELRVTLADFAKNNADMGALLHFYLMDAAALYDIAAHGDQDIPYTSSPVSSSSTIVLPAAPSAFPFTLQASFQNYCMFRWEILDERDRRDRIERYLQRSDELNIQAQNGIRIWTSNAQAGKFQVIGGGRTIPVEIGGAGEVVVVDIRWIRDENNQFRLMLIRLETSTSPI